MKQQGYKKKISPGKGQTQWNSLSGSNLHKLRTSSRKFDERNNDLYILRNSFSSIALKNNFMQQGCDLRHSNLHVTKNKHIDNLKSTLNKLQDKVNAAKEHLQIQTTSMRKKPKLLVHYDQVQEDAFQDKDEIKQNSTESSVTLKKSDFVLTSLITSVPRPKNFRPINTNPYSPRRSSKYYISEAIRASNEKNSLILEHINASIRIIRDCESYEIPQLSEMEPKKINLKRNERYRNNKTLVLDLDETLIHCVENIETASDLKLSIKLDGDENELHRFGINIRPYAMTFLKKMAKKFEIIIFTASQQEYADAILDELDPDRQIIMHRLYRQHCWVLENQMHIKDMRIINRNLSEIVLVDNAAYSYAFQLQNGIPILPFYQGSDFELSALEVYLDEIDCVADVRELNKQTFKLHHYTKFPNAQDLVEELYQKNH